MKINEIFKAIFVVSILILSINAMSDDLTPGNYVEEIRVADRSVAERDTAFGKALEQVLVKSTGNNGIAKLPKMEGQRSNAAVFVQSYTYVTREDNGQQALFLQIKFDPQSIERLMGQTIAQVDKQSAVLIWLAIRSNGNTIVTEESGDFTAALKAASTEANLNILLPSMDLQDVNKLTAEDICAQNIDLAKAASERYGTQTIAVGCITKTSAEGWDSQWSLQSKDNRFNWGFSSTNTNDIFADAMHHIAQSIGNSNGAAPPKVIVLRVTGISDLGQYAEVVKYLRQISPSSNVALISINANEVKLSVTGQQGQQALLVALNAQNKLTADSARLEGVDLNYHWNVTP